MQKCHLKQQMEFTQFTDQQLQECQTYMCCTYCPNTAGFGARLVPDYEIYAFT